MKQEISQKTQDLLPSWSMSCLAIWEKNWIDLCPGNFPTILGISNGVCLKLLLFYVIQRIVMSKVFFRFLLFLNSMKVDSLLYLKSDGDLTQK